jgi:nucleotide-binding universal stress UspA family protein
MTRSNRPPASVSHGSAAGVVMSKNVVLVPVDFGRASLRAIQVAGSQASATGGALVLLHVREPAPRGFDSLSPELGGSPDPRARLRARQQLERLARPWNGTTVMRDGAAVQTILTVADEVGARRITIGRHGVRGVERMLLGSVAEGVLRGSDVPVVVVGGNSAAGQVREPGSPRPRVLCAVDFDHGGPVIEAAAEYACEHGASLELVHVYEMPQLDAGGVQPMVVDGLDAALQRAAESELARLARRCGATRWWVRRGDIGNEVLSLLDALQAMVLVIGAHGRRRAPLAALGHVAHWLLRRSPTPVLVNRYQHAPVMAAAFLAS